ncbi:MAG: hypothetical protein HYZ29_19015 [Myxococcales bacterium]|nr:hypothetical protein [Myxococcales bacterium]
MIDHRVRFLLIGGLAVSAHAEPRFTKDLDVLVEATVANGRRLRAALTDFGFGTVAPAPSDLAVAGPGWVLGRAPLRIDILTRIAGVTFRRAWANRVHARLDAKRRVPVISRPDLIRAKRAAGRPQDLADVESLRKASRLAKRRRRVG